MQATTLLVILSLAFAVPVQAFAAGQYSSRPLAGFRAAHAPVVDGKLDDAVWKSAPKASEFIDRVTEQPAAEQTDAWLAYDDKAIYVAFHCRDNKPEEIVAREMRYGGSMGNDDTVRFEIDPFYTRRDDGSFFVVNARGTQREFVSGGRAANRDWVGAWQAGTQRVADGWTAEMRIPWEMLSYPNGAGLTMGINFHRYHARPQIGSVWSSLTRIYRPENVGVWQRVDPPAGARTNPLRWLSYLTGEIGQSSDTARPRAGLDLRYSPSRQNTGVLSIFPDFRNVEQAVEGIQFSRTERYVEETRPFFQEGEGFFPDKFYSRRIESFDVGAKAFGRVGSSLSYGLLGLARGDREGDAVGQLEYTFGERGALSAYGIVGRGGRPKNEQTGVEWRTRRGQWSHSGEWNRARTGPAGGTDMELRGGWRDGRWGVDVDYDDTSPDYSPALGFVGFTDSRSLSLDAEYDGDFRHGPLRSFGFSANAEYAARYSGVPYSRNASAFLYLLTRSNYQLSLSRSVGEFEGATDSLYSVRLFGNLDNRYRRWGIRYQWGVLEDVPARFLSFDVAQRLLGRLDVALTASFRKDVERREQIIGTVGWEFDAHRAIVGRLVQTDGRLNWYLAYRNAGGFGQEVYLILGDPNAERFEHRVALKWVWAG